MAAISIDKQPFFAQENYRPENRSTCLQGLTKLQSTFSQSLHELSTSLEVSGVQDQRIHPNLVNTDNFQLPFPLRQRVEQSVMSRIFAHALEICVQLFPYLGVDEIMDVI
jgi:hypothetical protein